MDGFYFVKLATRVNIDLVTHIYFLEDRVIGKFEVVAVIVRISIGNPLGAKGLVGNFSLFVAAPDKWMKDMIVAT